jgi:hypothetical protein
MADFLAAQRHGAFTEVFPDIFFVQGSFRFVPGVSITRNMTVVRQGNELALVNAIRLGPEGEAELDKLGTVKHLVRIGAMHGADDPYLVHRYGATLWALPRARHPGGLKTKEELGPGASPLANATVFPFAAGRLPEAAILLDRDDGILLTCDSYQNWTTFDGCSPIGKVMMRVMGFGPTLIGGPWVKAMGPAIHEDFQRMHELPFQHVIPGHGTPLRHTARDGLRLAMSRRFP